MNLKPEESALIDEESRILKTTIDSLAKQRVHDQERLAREARRSRELTSELVATRREEDRAMLASDEAVSHALTEKKGSDLKVLDKLIDKPYFARFVLEERDRGATKRLEYKLGFSSNPDCRIMDWRKAPVSKIYYEYREGEEYAEEIQGRERTGQVALRHSIEVREQELQRVTCRYGTFMRKGSDWERVSGNQSSHLKGGLPSILSLISAEQFKTITDNVETPLLIQGIAGSGKTTVALHRLAWLVHEDNGGINPEHCRVIVLNRTLKSYVEDTLPSMGVTGVTVLTYAEWVSQELKKSGITELSSEQHLPRPLSQEPQSVKRLKHSMALLQSLEHLGGGASLESFHKAIIDVLSNPKALMALDETRLLSMDLIKETKERVSKNYSEMVYDPSDDALILRWVQLNSQRVKAFEHIVVDEVQDFSAAQLATVLAAVDKSNHLTLVGDTAQQSGPETGFVGWEKLRHHWESRSEIPSFLELKISHRSTLPIMRFADHVQGRDLSTNGRPGRIPLWFRCKRESQAIEAALQWLSTAANKYPDALTSIICRNSHEAKTLFSLLQPTFGSTLRLAVNHDFSFEEGIVVTDIEHVRGLEFVNVLIWNPDSKSYSHDESSRNMLYIAVTRASENLCLVTWKSASPLLPHAATKLVRVYEPEDPEEN
ncbi:MAG: AAA family ATPase [Bdellovibrionales bacterium]|nr:AAA family ATPase [Bdellovibrionales bacterium]